MLDNPPSQPDIFERHLSPKAAKIFRTIVNATRRDERLALGVLEKLSALGVKAQFESALEKAPTLLVHAPSKDSSVLPSYWNFIHEVALRVFHPTANTLKDSEIIPLIALCSINLELNPSADSRLFMARFLSSFLQNIVTRHREEGLLTEEERTKSPGVPSNNIQAALRDIGNIQQFQQSLITDRSENSIFTKLDRDAFAALTKGPITQCADWEFLVNASGGATLSASQIQELQSTLADRISRANLPKFVTRTYLSTTLALWVWGNNWERDRQILGLDPRERLLQKAPETSKIGFGQFLIEAIPIVADIMDSSFSVTGDRARYSGKVGEERFQHDMRKKLHWAMALRLSPSVLLDSWRAIRGLDKDANICTAALVAFCSRFDAGPDEILATARDLQAAGLTRGGSPDVATTMLATGLLADIARIGMNQAVQAALDRSPTLSLASGIPSLTIHVHHEIREETAPINEGRSLITDLPSSDTVELDNRLRDLPINLGHQPAMTGLVKEILRLYPDRPSDIAPMRYMETIADALRFAEVVIRRKNASPMANGDPTDRRCVTAPASIIECLKIAHEYTKHFGPTVHPTIFGMVLTSAAGHDLRELFPQLFKGATRPAIKEIAHELTYWRKKLVLHNLGKWPITITTQLTHTIYGFGGFGVNQELFTSALGDQPPSFRFQGLNVVVAAAFKSGGLAFSPSLFLPDPLPLPYGFNETAPALERAWPDPSLNRYLIGHHKWLMFYSKQVNRREDLTAGQCRLPPTLCGEGVSNVLVRKSNGSLLAQDQLEQARKLISELNPAVTEDINVSNEAAFELSKQTVLGQLRLNIEKMKATSKTKPTNTQLLTNIDLLSKQAADLERATTPKQFLAVLSHTKFRLISDSAFPALQIWLSTFVAENERQNISAQTADPEGIRRGIVRLVTGVDCITRDFLKALATKDEKEIKAAEELIDKVFSKKKLNAVHVTLEQLPTEEREALYMHSSTAYELSLAGLFADTCAISEISPQAKNANIACIPFLFPLAPLNQPIFAGSAVIFGVLLADGSASVLIRPLNPTDRYLERYSAEDIIEGLLNEIQRRVISSGETGQHITSVTLPYEERSGGILSNRPDVVSYLKKRYFAAPDNYPRTTLMNPNAAAYRDAPILGQLVVVRRW
jgi:hypothetical protein